MRLILLTLGLLLAGCAPLSVTAPPAPMVAPVGTAPAWTPPHLDRVWRTLRAAPPFVSALVLVDDGPPPRAFVDDYFDGFNASAVHFWETGLPRQLAGWEASGRPGLRWFSWVDKDGSSRDGGALLGGVAPNRPGRVGYQIGDEPGLHGGGLAGVLPFRRGVEAVRALDPQALVVMNFSVAVPDIERILDYAGGTLGIDVFSFDRYNLGKRQYQSLELIRRYAQRYHRPYWRYLYGYRPEGEPRLTASDLRWDAMSGLVYGFTGFTWFIYQSDSMGLAPAFFHGPGYGAAKTELWQAAARINRDLKAYLGVTKGLWSTEVRYLALLPALQPPGTRPWRPGAGGDPYLAGLGAADDPASAGMEILAGFFRDDAGRHHVMLQNVRHSHASPPNDSDTAGTIRIRFDFRSAGPDLDPGRILVFDPRGRTWRPIPTRRRGPWGAVLDLPVDAGDAVLFKYAIRAPGPGT